MDEPIEAPDPPANVPKALIEELDSLTTRELHSVIKYARSRVEYLETPIPDLIDPEDDEEIIRVEQNELYTVVVKGENCEEGCEECPHDPHVYVVTIEPELGGGRHLHWEDIGRMMQ